MHISTSYFDLCRQEQWGKRKRPWGTEGEGKEGEERKRREEIKRGEEKGREKEMSDWK